MYVFIAAYALRGQYKTNGQHSLKSIQLVHFSETMNLLLTSAFLFWDGVRG